MQDLGFAVATFCHNKIPQLHKFKWMKNLSDTKHHWWQVAALHMVKCLHCLYIVVISTHLPELILFLHVSSLLHFKIPQKWKRRKTHLKTSNIDSTERRQHTDCLKTTAIYWFTMSIFISGLIHRLQATLTTLIYPTPSLQKPRQV